MSAVDTRRPPPAETQAAGEHRGPPSYALQAVASSVCTVLGELLGSSVTGKLVAGILGAWLGAFLTAPGRRHGRRIVAVGILLLLLDSGRALAAGVRPRRRSRAAGPHAPAGASSVLPASWTAVAAATAAGFVLGTGVTAAGHAVAGDGFRLSSRDSAAQATTRPILVPVPSVVGLRSSVAAETLQRTGFAPRAQPIKSPRPVGEVAEQRPTGGLDARKGSTVTLLVSAGMSGKARRRASGATAGPAPGGQLSGKPGSRGNGGQVTVPSVSGLSEASAVNALSIAGVKPTPSSQASDTVASGDAIGTTPAAGARVPRGSGVTLLVSSGSAEVVVPDVTGRSVDAATAILRSAGLRWSVIPGYCGEGTGGGPCTVYTQKPPGGTKVPRGSTIALDENSPSSG